MSYVGSDGGAVGHVQELDVVALFLDGDDLGGVPDGALRQLLLQRLQQEVALHAPNFVRAADGRNHDIHSQINGHRELLVRLYTEQLSDRASVIN